MICERPMCLPFDYGWWGNDALTTRDVRSLSIAERCVHPWSMTNMFSIWSLFWGNDALIMHDMRSLSIAEHCAHELWGPMCLPFDYWWWGNDALIMRDVRSLSIAERCVHSWSKTNMFSIWLLFVGQRCFNHAWREKLVYCWTLRPCPSKRGNVSPFRLRQLVNATNV